MKVQDMPNIGSTLAHKLNMVEIFEAEQLKALGSQQALIKIATLQNSSACINMLYALEGAVQNIRWHGLDKDKKEELKNFYRSLGV